MPILYKVGGKKLGRNERFSANNVGDGLPVPRRKVFSL